MTGRFVKGAWVEDPVQIPPQVYDKEIEPSVWVIKDGVRYPFYGKEIEIETCACCCGKEDIEDKSPESFVKRLLRRIGYDR